MVPDSDSVPASNTLDPCGTMVNVEVLVDQGVRSCMLHGVSTCESTVPGSHHGSSLLKFIDFCTIQVYGEISRYGIGPLGQPQDYRRPRLSYGSLYCMNRSSSVSAT